MTLFNLFNLSYITFIKTFNGGLLTQAINKFKQINKHKRVCFSYSLRYQNRPCATQTRRSPYRR